MAENVVNTAPADNGLKEVNEKMDQFLSGIEASKKQAAEYMQAAKDAQAKAQEALDAVTAAKNAHSMQFGEPAAKKTDKKELNKNFKSFLGQVKAAKYNPQVKAALSTDALTGSLLVGTDYVRTLVDLLVQYPAFVNGCRLLPWGSFGNEREIPQLVARPQVNNTAEGAPKIVSNPVFSNIKQKLKKLTSMVLWTREFTEDALIYLPDYIMSIVGPQFTIQLNQWLFQGNGQGHEGIANASGIVVPDNVKAVDDLAELKYNIPYQFRANGKFYIENSLYGELARISKVSAPSWMYYENGVMKIDGSEVVAVDPELIGNKIALFGDMQSVIFSPRNEIEVKYADQATIVETIGDTEVTHHLFQENKEAYLFETRADISVVGSVWAKADLSDESESESK